jgi:6-phosphogluconate dehydrogenase
MELGVIGLGRMGRIVVDRTLGAGHDVVAYDVDDAAVDAAADAGAEPAESIPDLAARMDARRVWLMVPAGDPVDAALDELEPHLDAGDIVVDGGNSHFEASVRRAGATEAAYLDCGTSGGPAAAERGFSLMVGGPEPAYDELEPVFDAVATGPDGHARMGGAGDRAHDDVVVTQSRLRFLAPYLLGESDITEAAKLVLGRAGVVAVRGLSLADSEE